MQTECPNGYVLTSDWRCIGLSKFAAELAFSADLLTACSSDTSYPVSLATKLDSSTITELAPNRSFAAGTFFNSRSEFPGLQCFRQLACNCLIRSWKVSLHARNGASAESLRGATNAKPGPLYVGIFA